MPSRRSLAAQLRARREELGLSQSAAARELEVARTAYRLWELEAAKPAPDRWRLVARWLGVSVSTLLLAEGLISDDEADSSTVAADRYEAATGTTVDLLAEEQTGDFFQQAQTMVDRSIERGLLTAEEAGHFRAMFRRIEKGLGSEASRPRGGLRLAPEPVSESED
ncbi:MAG TPA: helix-turn-helix transcriptional regulator [Actinomycetota bacterium]|nr:helix-turn-helix transcriptional regulator [Actinomycetota bacterium]